MSLNIFYRDDSMFCVLKASPLFLTNPFRHCIISKKTQTLSINNMKNRIMESDWEIFIANTCSLLKSYSIIFKVTILLDVVISFNLKNCFNYFSCTETCSRDVWQKESLQATSINQRQEEKREKQNGSGLCVNRVMNWCCLSETKGCLLLTETRNHTAEQKKTKKMKKKKKKKDNTKWDKSSCCTKSI